MQLVYGIAAIIAVLAAGGLSGATTITSTNFSEYEAEILSEISDLTVTLNGILAIKTAAVAAGDTQGTPVTMSSTGQPQANNALVKGNWGYKVTVDSLTGTSPATTEFKVELLRDAVIVDTLYVDTTVTPLTGEDVEVIFDLGVSTLGADESFLVKISVA